MTEPNRRVRWRPALLGLALSAATLGSMPATAGVLLDFDLGLSPDTIGPGSSSAATFTIENLASIGVTDLAFDAVLPAGLSVAAAPGLFTDCVNGLATAPAGGNSISFSEGRLSAQSSCTIRVNVTGAVPGSFSIASGILTSSAGSAPSANRDLTVSLARPGFSKSFDPPSIGFGERSTLTLTIDGSAVGSNLFNMTFVDVLPLGTSFASPTRTTTDCIPGALQVLPATDTIQFFSGFLPGGNTCAISVDVIGESVGTIENVTRELVTTAGTSGFATASLEVTGSAVNFRKQFQPNPALPGELIDLVYTLQNTERSFNAEQLTFSDDLDAAIPGAVAVGLPLVDPCGSGSTVTGAGVIALNGARLAPDASCSFAVPVQLPAGIAPSEYLSATSALESVISGLPITSAPAIDTLFVNEVPVPTKTFLSSPIGAGEIATVEFTLTNPSATDSATEIAFSDNITAFMTEATVAALPGAGFCGAGSFASATESFGDLLLNVTGMSLPPGGSCTFSVDLAIAAGTPPGVYRNTTSEVSATIGGSTATGRSASDDLEVLGSPRLTAEFIDDPVLPGGLVTLAYTLDYPEDASTDVTGVSFTHDLDAALAGLTSVSPAQLGVCGTGSQIAGTSVLTLSGATLSPGETCTFSVSIQVPLTALPADYPTVTGAPSGTVSGETVSGVPANGTLAVAGIEFDKAFIDDPVLSGGTVTLRYTLNNVGSGTLSAGFFSDGFSSALPGLAATAPLPASPCGAGSAISGTTVLILTGLELAPGSSCSFDVTLSVPAGAAPGSYSSLTSSLSAQYDGSPIQISPAADVLEIRAISEPVLAKAFTDDPVQPGDPVTLEFTLSNPDPVEAMSGLSFTDDLDAVLPGLTATGLPAADVCGTGSTWSGSSILTLIGGTLAPGASCTFTATLQVPAGVAPGEYINTTSSPVATVGGQSSTGRPATDRLQVAVLAASKSFANPGVTGSTTTLSYTLVNPGSTRLDDLALTDDLNAVVPGLTAVGLPLGDVCGGGSSVAGSSLLVLSGASLAPGASCTFDVTISIPSTALPGIYASSTSAVTSAGLPVGSPAVANLQVVGIPELTVLPATVDFGSLRVGTPSAPQAVTLENIGNDLLTIDALDMASGPFARIGGTCSSLPIQLAPSGTCTLTYGFSPLSVGPASLTLQVQSDDPASPDAFTLIGTGIESALDLTPNPLDFGPVRVGTTSPSRTVTVSNPGTASLNVTAIDPASAPFSVGVGTCGPPPFSVPPGLSCTLAYEATPVAVGPASSGLGLISDAPDSPSTLTLTVTGTESILQFDPDPLDFGNVGIGTDSPVRSVTVSNPGSAELNVTALDTPPAPFSVAGGSCGSVPFSLGSGASCTLDYRVSPIAVGPAQVDLSLTSDAPSSPDTLGLRANGTPPTVTLSPNPLDFGDIGIDTTSPTLSVTVANSSAAVLDVTGLDFPALPFAAVGGSCGGLPFQVDPGASCTLDYTFSPTALGPAQIDLDLTSNAPSSPDRLSLVGNGTPPALSLDSTLLQFGPVPIQTVAERNVVLTSTGAGTLVIDALLPPAAPFALDNGSCGALPITLASGQSCSLRVRFTPEAILSYASTFEIESNDPDSPLTVEVEGTGQPLAIPSLDALGLALLMLLLGMVGLRASKPRAV